jgi:two-component system response regulator AtoC
MPDILIVDDDKNVGRVLKDLLGRKGFDVDSVTSVFDAQPVIEEGDLDLIITDLKMPGLDGMDLLTECRAKRPEIPVIMISAFGSVDAAVNAMKRGAYSFITKPVDETELLNVVNNALAESGSNQEMVSDFFKEDSGFSAEFIGRSPAITDIMTTIRKIGPTDATVLITGETGVGKELIARAIHLASGRKEQPFVKVNCSAIPETLIESELFGYAKGAFTGAVTDKPGRFEIANKGTLFLDEIGEVPLHLQVKLLTVLQDKAFERVGGVRTVDVDIRIVAATNKEMKKAVDAGEFRADLHFRLNVVPVHIPPLRLRLEDLDSQIDYFVMKYGSQYGRGELEISPEVRATFTAYNWPGNTRELENMVERMVLLSDGPVLTADNLPSELTGLEFDGEAETLKGKQKAIYQVTERKMIIDALEKTGGNRTRAAKILGVSRRTLQSKVKDYDL